MIKRFYNFLFFNFGIFGFVLIFENVFFFKQIVGLLY